MSDGTELLRDRSKLLFGNVDRLQVAAAVAAADAGDLYARALSARLGWPDNRVQKQLKQLEAAGLLMALPSVGGERRVYYERIDSVLWELVVALRDEWLNLSAPANLDPEQQQSQR